MTASSLVQHGWTAYNPPLGSVFVGRNHFQLWFFPFYGNAGLIPQLPEGSITAGEPATLFPPSCSRSTFRHHR